MKRKKTPVNVYTIKGEYLTTFNNTTDASNFLDISRSVISKICREHEIQTNGFVFRYNTEEYPVGVNINVDFPHTFVFLENTNKLLKNPYAADLFLGVTCNSVRSKLRGIDVKTLKGIGVHYATMEEIREYLYIPFIKEINEFNKHKPKQKELKLLDDKEALSRIVSQDEIDSLLNSIEEESDSNGLNKVKEMCIELYDKISSFEMRQKSISEKEDIIKNNIITIIKELDKVVG